MKPTTNNLFIGDVLAGSEAAFLRTLATTFIEPDTLIFANFQVRGEQIDFVVVTPTHAGVIELKWFTGPVFGGMNGAWELTDSTGHRVPYVGSSNPYAQALREAYALSDAMKAYARQSSAPAAPGGKFFLNFRTYVAIAPQIHAGSNVTRGDNKAQVLSAADVVDNIRTIGHVSTWRLDDWRRFAVDRLGLQPVTLEQATDPLAIEDLKTLGQFRRRSTILFGTDLAPLIDPVGEEPCGASLIAQLLSGENIFLTGASGSGKTFHVHHAAIAMLGCDTEVPLVVEAKRYRGGAFRDFLRECLAPVFPGEPEVLIRAIGAAARPVLVVDALNECAPSHRDALLRDATAFALRCNARTIVTGHTVVPIPGLSAKTLILNFPEGVQKTQIFAYHAGLSPSSEIDRFCRGFRNAYELTLAGRCYRRSESPKPETVADLYSRYVAECLPPHHTMVGGALARHLAAAMGDRGSLYLTRRDCEVAAQRFLREHGAPLSLLDDLLDSKLLEVAGDTVTFEHELLVSYLRAVELKQNSPSAEQLAGALLLPKNHVLVEFILPWLDTAAEVRAILENADDVDVLIRAYDGMLGPLSQIVISEACREFEREALVELDQLDVRLAPLVAQHGRLDYIESEVVGLSALGPFDERVADVFATHMDDAGLRAQFLTMLDATETALHRALTICAQGAGIATRALWSDLLWRWMNWSGPQIRSALVVRNLARVERDFHRTRVESSLHTLLPRALDDPSGILALYLLLSERSFSAGTPNTLVTLVERAWATGIPYLQMTALTAIADSCGPILSHPAAASKARTFLEPLTSRNLMLSTVIVEAQSRFGMIERPLTDEDALAEMRAVIEWDVPEVRNLGSDVEQGAMAYSLLSRIFEDVFDGAYGEAYERLSDDERLTILMLAAAGPEHGFHREWIMGELLRANRIEALPTFRRAAMMIDTESSFPQDAVAFFVLGVYGLSKYAEAPPTRATPKSNRERAWFVIGDALFWAYHDGGRYAQKRGVVELDHLDDDSLPWAAVALRELSSAAVVMSQQMPTFENAYPAGTRRIATHALAHREELGRVKGVSFLANDVDRFLVNTLSVVGDAAALPVLRSLIDDPIVGHAAIQAIRSIEGRQVGTRSR